MAKKKPKQPTCNCIEECNAMLAPSGVRIKRHLMIDIQKTSATGSLANPSIELEKLNGKGGRLPALFAAFCPFCGVKYAP